MLLPAVALRVAYLFIHIFLVLIMDKKWAPPLMVVLILVGFVLQFYRDPERVIPSEGVVSPADGEVIAIERVEPEDIPVVVKNGEKIYLEELKGIITEECYLIAIFMDPFDVHVNRSPIAGTVTSIIYVEGAHDMASHLALQNERNSIVIDSIHESRVVVIQIAGKFVRRIQWFINEGDFIEKGERIGRIVLGSQVVLIIPTTYTITVSLKDHVKAGESIIALP